MSLDYRTVIAHETDRLIEVVRRGPLEARVPGCPEWNLAELAIHLGGVQQWATHILRTGNAPGPGDLAPKPDDLALAADYLASSPGPLLDAITTVDPAKECWNFTGKNQTASFWHRRQALEVAFHRWDAESAIGDPVPIDAAVAADGIDEFVNSVIGRVLSRTGADTAHLTGDVHLHCTDTEGEWTFEVVNGALEVRLGHGKAAAAVRGPASDLALFLYNRVPADRVELFGNAQLVQDWMTILRF